MNRCFICHKNVKEQDFAFDNVAIHMSCTTKCKYCTSRAIDENQLFLQDIVMEDFQYLHPVFLRSLQAFLVASKFSNIKSFRKVPRDILKLIVGIIVNSDYESRRSYNLRCEGKLDLYGTCTLSRCRLSSKCPVCSHRISWYENDLNHCRLDRCSKIAEGIQTINEKVFNRTLWYGPKETNQILDAVPKTHVSWPFNNNNGIKITNMTFIQKARKLSHEQITFYNAMMETLRSLLK